MAVASSSEKPVPLSYAERAKRASAAAVAANTANAPTNGRAPVVNGSAHLGESGASSRDSKTSTGVIGIHSTSPPPSSSASVAEDGQAFPPIPKSPSKPPPNVWAARKEQQNAARVAAQGQSDATGTKEQTERTAAPSRSPLNGILNTTSRDEHANASPSNTLDDPFVVRVPNQSHSPPSLDDTKSWPVVTNPVPPTAIPTVPPATGESSSSTGTNKKGECKSILYLITLQRDALPLLHLRFLYTLTFHYDPLRAPIVAHIMHTRKWVYYESFKGS